MLQRLIANYQNTGLQFLIGGDHKLSLEGLYELFAQSPALRSTSRDPPHKEIPTLTSG
jgi:hypothetical protein